MTKRFCFIMFCIFVLLTFIGFYIVAPVGTCISFFMACVYLSKIINYKEEQ